MAQGLTRYRDRADAVFDLLGRGEVDLTAALGCTLTRSPALMSLLWERLVMPGDPTDVEVELERADEAGRTDLELVNGEAHVIVEAKKGWLVPGESQLATYAPILEGLATRLLVSLSDSSEAWANLNLPDLVSGVAVRHLPWDAMRDDLRAASASTRSPTERVWLNELTTYLAGATAVRHPSDQWTYCVVVSNTQFGERSTFRELVEKRRVYFHPFGGSGGWPKRAPTLWAFRWGGWVQQVNRVEEYEIVSHLNDHFPDIPRAPGEDDDPHIVYTLGPNIPIPEIRTTGTWASGRVWTLLDQLLTSSTLKEAMDRSKVIDPT